MAVEEYDVRPRELTIPAGKLSGGNQQKLIVAREFQRQPRGRSVDNLGTEPCVPYSPNCASS